jgi:hypothetical protein
MSGADPEAEGRGNVRDPGIDLITKHFDAKPRDAVSRAFQQDCEISVPQADHGAG